MLSVSIVTYKTDLKELKRCLSSLTSESIDTIYIVDNSSEERIKQFCSHYPKLVYIASDNVGFGAGHNKAIRQSRSEYHLVLNSDVYFPSPTIDELLRYMDANSDVGALQPEITYPDGTPQYTTRLLPTPFDVFARRFLPSSIIRHRNDSYLLKDIDRSKVQNIPYHQGSFMMIRRRVLDEIGLFDERFFMYPEDIDLTRRIHDKYRTVYYPYVKIIHDHRAGSYHSFKLLRIHIINMIKYFNKWGWFFDKKRRYYNRRVRNSTK